jgi:nicotinamidase-related amidase
MQRTQLALLLVDIQRDFWKPLQDVPQFASFPDNIRTLLNAARTHCLPVIHIQSVFKADRSDWMLFYRPEGRGLIPCIEGSDGVIIEEFATPIEGEPIIRKQTFDGLVNTDLERVLRERNIKAVLIAGLDTSVCVLFTATAAYLRRFVPFVVSDACADRPEKHEAALRMYNGLCFQTVTTAQVRDDLAAVVRQAAAYADTFPS